MASGGVVHMQEDAAARELCGRLTGRIIDDEEEDPCSDRFFISHACRSLTYVCIIKDIRLLPSFCGYQR